MQYYRGLIMKQQQKFNYDTPDIGNIHAILQRVNYNTIDVGDGQNVAANII